MGLAETSVDFARRQYAEASWRAAFDAFTTADSEASLGPADLELMARAAYMLGQDDDYVADLERAHRGHLNRSDLPRAAGCAFWIGHNMLFRGNPARANGWFSVGHRLLSDPPTQCVEAGYLLIPKWLEEMGAGNWESGFETAGRAARIGEDFGDTDLIWLARDEQARALVRQGRTREGLDLVDEVLIVVDSRVLSPIVSGIVYCNTIAFCRDAHAERQAREWTDALTAWCDTQPQMVAHRGLCLVHSAEVMELRGNWADALEMAARAAAHFTDGALNQIACGRAHYRQGEIHRLAGRLAEAEACFRSAHRAGYEPQPGLALVRMAEGQPGAAAAAIRRAVAERLDPLERAPLLPAYVRIMIELGDVDAARAASRQLDELAAYRGTESLRAMADQARARVALAEGDAGSCLGHARSAWQAWHELEAPYEAAMSRVLVARACLHLGDADSADLELRTARETFARLQAAPDVREVDAILRDTSAAPRSGDVWGLSPRELEVLGLLVSGRTNRQIADEMVISEHTVARHLQNLFTKLGVTSRTAASTFAFEHDLLPGSHGQD